MSHQESFHKRKGSTSMDASSPSAAYSKLPADQGSASKNRSRSRTQISERAILWIFCAGVFCSNIGATIVGPLFPQEADRRGVSQFTIGVLMGIHPLFSVLSSFWMGKIMVAVGRKQLMAAGSAMQGAGYLVLGLLRIVPQSESYQALFYFLAVLGEALSGTGATLYTVPCFACVPMVFKGDCTQVIGYLEMLSGLALALGYVVASILYELGGYVAPFCVIACVVFALVPATKACVPDNAQLDALLNARNAPATSHSEDVESSALTRDDAQQSRGSESTGLEDAKAPPPHNTAHSDVSYVKLFSDSRISLTYLVNLLPTAVLLFLEPTYSLFLERELHIEAQHAGYFLCVMSIAYFIVCPIVGRVQKNVGQRTILGAGLYLFAVQLVLQGPAPFTRLRATVTQQVAVQALNGAASALIFIVAMPEFMDLVRDHYPNCEQTQSDVASALYNSSYHFGEILGPIVGSLLTQLYSFQETSTFFGWIVLALAIVYTAQYNTTGACARRVKRRFKAWRRKSSDDEGGEIKDGGSANSTIELNLSPQKKTSSPGVVI